MTRRTAVTLLTSAFIPPAGAAARDHAARALAGCRQLLRVESPSWRATAGVLTLWSRSGRRGVWRQDGAAIPVVLGKHGLRWGLGLHTPPHGAVMKREGDGCSPAGIFELDTGFGAMPAEASGAPRWPWRQMTAAHAGVDDPASRHYNRIVDSAAVARDWHSAENMMPESGAYRRGVVVRHNWSQLPGAGSCIFLHIRPPGRTSTSGCTAMSARDFLRLLGWLDTAQRPLLVQLPAPEWLACAAAHGLPGPTPARQTTKNAQPAR